MTLISIQSILHHQSTVQQGNNQTGAALEECPSKKCSLAQVHPGHKAKICSFSPKISCQRRAHLLAYGLLPGHWVRVIRHSPVTVLEIEHLELALETELAGEIQVDEG